MPASSALDSGVLTNPLDALVLPRVLRWVKVVFRQKTKCGHLDSKDGRPWSRIPAKDLVAQIEREEGLVVSTRRIQRSLERLATQGHFARKQRTKWWGQRDFWYSFADSEWEAQQQHPIHLARSAPKSEVTSQRDRRRHSEASVPTPQILSPLLTNQTSSKTAAKPNSRNGKSRSVDPLETLRRVAKRAESYCPGFGRSSSPSPLTTASTEVWEEDGFRFERLPSGVVVKDLIQTAPLR